MSDVLERVEQDCKRERVCVDIWHETGEFTLRRLHSATYHQRGSADRQLVLRAFFVGVHTIMYPGTEATASNKVSDSRCFFSCFLTLSKDSSIGRAQVEKEPAPFPTRCACCGALPSALCSASAPVARCDRCLPFFPRLSVLKSHCPRPQLQPSCSRLSSPSVLSSHRVCHPRRTLGPAFPHSQRRLVSPSVESLCRSAQCPERLRFQRLRQRVFS